MTDAEEEELLALLEAEALAHDFERFARDHLKIKPKKPGPLVPLILNEAQRYVHEKLEEQRLRTGKVRALILKARQQGFSTYVGGRYYHRATHTEDPMGRGSAPLSHRQSEVAVPTTRWSPPDARS